MVNKGQDAGLLLLRVLVEVGIGLSAGLGVKAVVAVVGLPAEWRQTEEDLLAVFRILVPLRQSPLLEPALRPMPTSTSTRSTSRPAS